MRFAKLKTAVFSIIVCSVLAVGMFKTSQAIMNTPQISPSPLEAATGLTYANTNHGNNSGIVYSIDGEPISEIYTSEEGLTSLVAKENYESVLGSEKSGVGLIGKCENILKTNAGKLNRELRKGDNIATTLHSKGTAAAMRELYKYDGEATISVVLKDGAVLVSAALPSDRDDYSEYFVDRNASSDRSVGSTFKVISDRMFLLNNDMFGEEFSMYNESFTDYSYFTLDDNTIYNWDNSLPYCYDEYEGGDLYSRSVSLSEALKYSSNTYHLRHAVQLGLSTSYNNIKELYGLDSNLVTDINELDFNEVSENRLPYFFWGQDAKLSPVRLCQMYNYTFSGEFFVPFYVGAVFSPDGGKIYVANPQSVQERSMEIDLQNDILADALAECFEYYLDEVMQNELADLIASRRILCKSGTAELGETYNSVMMMTVLNEDRSDVICSACISINDSFYIESNQQKIISLLKVLISCGVI